jgi:hypothetical protein
VSLLKANITPVASTDGAKNVITARSESIGINTKMILI